MDKVTEERIKILHPRIIQGVTEAIITIEKRGVGVRLTQTLRTIMEQNNLFAQGRTQEQLNKLGLTNVIAKPSMPKVTNARGGLSWHNFGLGADFILMHKDKTISYNMKEDLDKDGVPDWMECVEEFTKRGFDWGGNWTSFPDYPHIQKTFGLTIQRALEMFNAKKVDSRGYIQIPF